MLTAKAASTSKTAARRRHREPLTGRLLTFDALALRFTEFRIEKSPSRRCCGADRLVDRLIDYEEAPCAAAPAERLTPAGLKDLMAKNATLDIVDIREAGELAEGTLPVFRHVPVEKLLAGSDSLLDPQTLTLLVCRSDKRSLHAATVLRTRGYSGPLPVLQGGIPAWLQEPP
ncbi:MAG: hypothetical protein LBR29_09340 [Methylobacteriaceae bacterium]|jgi:adenylyltransferase/sulfurtransferase|nr:hypothetical protein [Methylobacteriaceae bacterium]